jgi:hypothetical protein
MTFLNPQCSRAFFQALGPADSNGSSKFRLLSFKSVCSDGGERLNFCVAIPACGASKLSGESRFARLKTHDQAVGFSNRDADGTRVFGKVSGSGHFRDWPIWRRSALRFFFGRDGAPSFRPVVRLPPQLSMWHGEKCIDQLATLVYVRIIDACRDDTCLL